MRNPPPIGRLAGAVATVLPLMAALALITGALFIGLGAGQTLFVTTLLINTVLVVGLQVFIGNTGIVSFGHGAFIAIGAYASGLLTLPVATKAAALPRLPEFLAGIELPILPAVLIAVVFAGLLAIPVGIPIVRLAGAAASIATFALLVITNGILVGASSLTRGTQTFYGVPPFATLDVVLVATCVIVGVALLFRLSRLGLMLQASAEDEVAASASGIDVRRLRLLAWVLSAMVAAAGGALLGHMLTSFAPSTFYLTQTLALLTMLILGGSRSVTGAVAGTVIVTAVFEGLRRAENGLELGPIQLPVLYGLQQLGLGLFLLIAIRVRPDGLLGDKEFTPAAIPLAWRPRRLLQVADPDATSDVEQETGEGRS